MKLLKSTSGNYLCTDNPTYLNNSWKLDNKEIFQGQAKEIKIILVKLQYLCTYTLVCM